MENDELDDQDPSSVDDQDDDPSDDDDGGPKPAAGEGDAAKSVKIGDKEYTPEQIADMEKKASGYDALLPEFTKKSQKLSELEQASKPKEDDLPSYKRQDWNPKTFAEVGKAIEEAEERGMKRALSTLEERQKQIAENKAKVKEEVDDFVAEVKKTNKEFDDKDFFSYTVKHKFPLNTIANLRSVYSSYAELQQNLEPEQKEKRKDRVNAPSGGKETGPDFTQERVRGGSIFDTAMDAFERLKSK